MNEEYINSFAEKVSKETSASKEEVLEAIKPILATVKKDITPEEMLDEIILGTTDGLTTRLKTILNDGSNTLIPGYTFQIKMNDIDIKVYGGNFANGNSLTSDAIFDIASISKQYTEVIACNLIKDGIMSFDDKVTDLDPRFLNLSGITIRDLMKFSVTFETPGRIDDAKTSEEALDRLLNTKAKISRFNYNDIGMMVLKEVMEKASDKSYEELLQEYVIDKLDLNDTYLTLPEEKREIFTGSANEKIGMVNDPKAVMFGGYSGHAGVKTTSDDLIRFMMAPYESNELLGNMSKLLYEPSGIYIDEKHDVDARAFLGSSKISTTRGIDFSDATVLAPKVGNSISGSTRTVASAGRYTLHNTDYVYGNTILLNPNSRPFSEIKQLEDEENEKRRLGALEQGVEYRPVSYAKEYTFDGQIYRITDPRGWLKFGTSTDKMAEELDKTNIQLLFLQDVIYQYDKNYKINYKNESNIKR